MGNLERVIRIDAGTLRAPVETPQGFLKVDGYAGRTGIYEYMNEDGTIRRELRPADEVGKQKSLDGFEGAPITDGHPTVPVTSRNVRSYEVGSATKARMDGDAVATTMVIKDPAVIAKVKSRQRTQLSPGYALDYDPTPGADTRYAYPGNPEGRYDGVQRNIDINHLALVDEARGGPRMKLRMDQREHEVRAYRFDGMTAATLVMDEELDADARNKLRDSQFAFPEEGKLPINDEEHTQNAMSRFSQTDFSKHAGAEKRAYGKIVAAAKKFGIDSTSFEKEYGGRTDNQERARMADSNPSQNNDAALRSVEAQLINVKRELVEMTEKERSATARADSAEASITELKKQIPTLQAEIAAGKLAGETVAVAREKTRADNAESALTKLNATRTQEIRDRVKLEREAAVTLGVEVRMDSLDDRALRCMVIKKLRNDAAIGNDQSDDAIRGTFNTLVQLRDDNARSLAQVSQVLDASKQVESKKRADEQQKERWMKPLPNAALKT